MTELELCRRCDEPIQGDGWVLESDYPNPNDPVFCSLRCLENFETTQETR